MLKTAATLGGSVALGVFGTLVSFVMMLFLLFFFLQDGRAMLARLTRLIPMEPRARADFSDTWADVTRAVVFGSTATALIQGIFVGVGFAIVGLPSPVVFGVLATIAAFLPAGASGGAGAGGALPDVRRSLGHRDLHGHLDWPPCGSWRTSSGPS